MKNALYVPSYNTDIFSVKAATERGASVVFTPEFSRLIAKDGTAFEVESKGKLYYLNNVSTDTDIPVQKKKSHTLQEWHRILGHCNVKDVLKLESIVEGMHISNKSNFECETCIMGKMTEYRNRAPDKRAERSLELVHCDIGGPITPTAREGFKYAINFVDDYSGATAVYFLKNKSGAPAALERFLADSAPYGNMKRFRRDNALEFTSDEFNSILVKNRIKSELSCPYSPHQNGTAERSWRTLFDMARCLLLEAGLPKKLWTYAVKASAYIRNRCYNPRLGKTPFEALTGEKPNLANMHTFGTICYAYLQNKKKLDARCEKGIFVGYDSQSPAFLVYFPNRDDVRKVRCVTFNETFAENVKAPRVGEDYHYCQPNSAQKEENTSVQQEESEDVQTEGNGQADRRYPEEGEDVRTEGNGQAERRYPERIRRKPGHLEDYVTGTDLDKSDEGDVTDAALCSVHYCYRISSIPNTFEEAIQSPEAQQWQTAMEEEVKALKEKDTYELTELPDGRAVIGGRWVYAVKQGPENEEKCKARYVAKGYSQIEGIDYKETFSPTAKLTSIRMLMQIAVQENLIVHQMDVKTAYLNADIDTELYVEQPKGFIDTDRKLVWKLKKSLYGLKQSGRNWNNLLHKCLMNEDFNQSFSDPCVYTKFEGNDMIIILFWVDDIIIAASHYEVLTQ